MGIDVGAVTVTVQKGEGITQALKRYIGENKDSFKISDNDLTANDCFKGFQAIKEINEKRETSIFSGGSKDNDWKNSYIVHAGQQITFTQAEMEAICKSMGVELTKADERTDSEAPIVQTNVTVTPTSTAQLEEANVTETSDSEKLTKAERGDGSGINEDGRWELSWKQIGNCAKNSAKNFLKSFVCDKDGKFSWKKTILTAGTVAACIFAAPLVASLGASALVVTGIKVGLSAVGLVAGLGLGAKGVTNWIKGYKQYRKATTEEDALASMSRTTDGIVETAVAVPTIILSGRSLSRQINNFRTIRSTANNTSGNTSNGTGNTTQEQQTVMNKMHAENQAQRQVLNNIENNSKGGDQLTGLKEQLIQQEAATAPKTSTGNNATVRRGTHSRPLKGNEITKKIKLDKAAQKPVNTAPASTRTVTMSNNNTYTIKNGQVTEVRIPQGNGATDIVLTTATKIAKHLFKQRLNVTDIV